VLSRNRQSHLDAIALICWYLITMSHHIAIDVRCLQDASRFRGIGAVIRQLLPFFKDDPLFVLFATQKGPDFDAFGMNVLYFDGPSGALPDFLKDNGVTHFHFMAQYNVPENFLFPHTITVHDLFTRYSGKNNKKDAQLVAQMRPRLALAKAWFVISEFVKKDLIERLQFSEASIFVIPPGVPDAIKNATPDFSIISDKKINLPFVLAIGDFEPRKNMLAMIAAFLRFNQDKNTLFVACIGKGTMVPLPLLVRLWLTGRLKEFRFVNYLEVPKMAALYRQAKALCFVSKAEGFGLPVLEALQVNLPVLTSTKTSLPEVGQDAVMYADPDSVEDISKQLREILTHPIQNDAGPILAQFTFEKMAAQMKAQFFVLIPDVQ